MQESQDQIKPVSNWQKTQYANLIRYVPSGRYFARIRVGGKLIRQSLKTTKVTVAKLRLADLEKQERAKEENKAAVAEGKMLFKDAMAITWNGWTGTSPSATLETIPEGTHRRVAGLMARIGDGRCSQGQQVGSPELGREVRTRLRD